MENPGGANDDAQPSAEDIALWRTVISALLPSANSECEEKTLRAWLQAPKLFQALAEQKQLSGEAGLFDSNCHPRATEMFPGVTGVKVTSVAACENVDKARKQVSFSAMKAAEEYPQKITRIVSLKIPGRDMGASESVFIPGSFHHVIVLGSGKLKPSGRRYLVVFDPDVSATKETRRAWNAAVARQRQANPLLGILTDMVLGLGDGLGPVIRFHVLSKEEKLWS